jgi:hypothetical protein
LLEYSLVTATSGIWGIACMRDDLRVGPDEFLS